MKKRWVAVLLVLCMVLAIAPTSASAAYTTTKTVKFKSVETGSNVDGSYIAAIAENGDLYTWGDNRRGQVGNGTTEDQLTPVKVLCNVSSFYGGVFSHAAITTDRNLYVWNYSQPTPLKVLDDVASFERYSNAMTAITTDGSLYIWGENYDGMVGNGTTENQSTPFKVLSDVAFVDVGSTMTAITTDGSLYVWGDNDDGQVGNGTTEDQLTPLKVLSDVSSISIEGSTMAAITTDGSLYVWGDNYWGQVGNGTTENQLTPLKILSDVSSVSIQDFNTAAITTDGSLYVWGDNDDGQVGNGTTEDQLTPVKVLGDVSSVSLGICHGDNTAAITTDGSLYVWGDNDDGQVGNGTTEDQLTPVKVLSDVSSISFYYDNMFAITTDRSLYAWGSDQLTPTKVLSNVDSFEHNWGAMTAITTDGSLYVWGKNYYGQVGNGTTEDQRTPLKVLDDVASTRYTGYTRAAITTDGSLYVWGENYGLVGNGTKENQLTPFKVLSDVDSFCISTGNTAAITTDGSLYVWGINDCGNVGNGTTEDQLTPYKIEITYTETVENPFQDVEESAYYYEPVLWAVDEGVTSGMTATTFKPNRVCTRGQVVTFLWRAAGCPEPETAVCPFVDVASNRFYYKAVLWAYENGITAGIDATHFMPESTVTRGQFVTFLWRAEGKPAAGGSNPFTDLNPVRFYYDAVLWAAQNGIAAGTTATTFAPEGFCTRGQVVTFLYRNYAES